MREYQKQLSCILIVVLCFTVWLPVTPVYAFSLSDLTDVSSGGGLMNILFGMLFTNLLGKANPHDSLPSAQPPIKNSSLGGKEIIGFFAEWWGKDTSSFESLSRNVESINTIASFWATLQEDGSVTDRGGEDHRSVVEYAHNHNVSVLLLVNNAKESNDRIPIHTILSNPTLRTKAIANLEAYVKKYKLDGINIDFEMVPAADRDNLTLFMQELSDRFKPLGYLVSIAVFPKQDESNDVAYAYDYGALARYADKIMLMTYDQHGAWSGPGPIAAGSWVDKNLAYALRHIPKTKLYLGIAAYGYDWSVKGVESLGHRQVTELAQKYKAAMQWDEQSQTSYFHYIDTQGVEHQVWFENSASLKVKLDLVMKYDIAGIAMWKLGEEDSGYWPLFRDKLKK